VNDSFKFNQETEFVPILGLIESELNATPQSTTKTEATNGPAEIKASSIQENHHPALLSLIASELSIAPEEIHDFEL
jgi:aspartyl aminopeptidase